MTVLPFEPEVVLAVSVEVVDQDAEDEVAGQDAEDEDAGQDAEYEDAGQDAEDEEDAEYGVADQDSADEVQGKYAAEVVCKDAPRAKVIRVDLKWECMFGKD